jgi:pSer/pThr/pTyr-binding forkhead associated (FHA) protein
MASSSFQLIMRLGPTPGKIITLSSDEVSLGRDIVNEIIINDPELSRKHAKFVKVGGGYQLEDLGSTNGTYVNGQRLMGPHQLASGELIMFGENVGMVFERTSFDPDATLVSEVESDATPTPPGPMPAYTPPPSFASSRRVSITPSESIEPERRQFNPWLVAGVGCLVIALCVIVVGVILFDALNLYCREPFRAIMDIVWPYCP